MLSEKDLEKLTGSVSADMEHGSLADMLVACTIAYFTWWQKGPRTPFAIIRAELYQFTIYFIGYCNQIRNGSNKKIRMDQKKNKGPNAPVQVTLPTLRVPENLAPVQIAYALYYCWPIVRIACAGEDSDEDRDLTAVYQSQGPKAGLYDTSDTALNNLIVQMKQGISPKEIIEVKQTLRSIIPRKERCEDADLIAVGNGIINYKTKDLLPFNPKYIFLGKSPVNYNPNAQNVTIHNPDDGTDWNVEDWVKDLFDDPAIVNLIWEILGAIIRPTVPWDKCVFFSGPSGANGKGTLALLMRNLCGKSAASISFSNFGKNFMLEPLIGASANISDEEDVGVYLDKAANFKAAVTGDVLQINRKNKPPVFYKFKGLFVQCINALPRVQDTTDSLYRRCLFVPFEKTFTGRERKYIKNDYLNRPEVLEYVLYRVLNMRYYRLSEPAACCDALNEYKRENDPIRQWWEEVSDQFVWHLLPWKFLYECYKHWSEVNNRSGRVQSRQAFIARMRKIGDEDSIWEYPGKGPDGKDKQISAAGRIVDFEPLAKDYYMPDTDMHDPNKCNRILGLPGNWQGNQRGLLRRPVSQSGAPDGD